MLVQKRPLLSSRLLQFHMIRKSEDNEDIFLANLLVWSLMQVICRKAESRNIKDSSINLNDSSYRKLTVFSNSGSKKAILSSANGKCGAGSGDDKGELLQIYSKERLLKTYDLKELDKHNSVYTSAGKKICILLKLLMYSLYTLFCCYLLSMFHNFIFRSLGLNNGLESRWD